jgi:hypothetical protein
MMPSIDYGDSHGNASLADGRVPTTMLRQGAVILFFKGQTESRTWWLS